MSIKMNARFIKNLTINPSNLKSLKKKLNWWSHLKTPFLNHRVLKFNADEKEEREGKKKKS